MIRICSRKRPDRCPARPALAPATERSWHGLPPQMMSTGGSFAPSSLVISPTCCIWGNRSLVTAIGKASISLAQTGSMPLRTAAKGKPPMPSNRLPIVIFLSGSAGLFSSFLIFFTPFQKNFFSRPCFPPQSVKAGNIFCIFPLYLQKVHNSGVKKGRFLRKILAKIALNRKRAGSSPPW